MPFQLRLTWTSPDPLVSARKLHFWASRPTCAKMMTTKYLQSPCGLMMRLGCMIKPDHCVRCVNITQSEVISKSTSRSADGPFSERTWLFLSLVSLYSCSHFWQLAEAFCDITSDNQDWAVRAAGIHQQCGQSLNIPAGVWPEHKTVRPDLAHCSTTSSFHLVVTLGCAWAELVRM